jgi:hypothetical protein
VNFTIRWVYKTEEETDINDRYEFDGLLDLDMRMKAFFPHLVTGTPKINGISFITSQGGASLPVPTFKFLTTISSFLTFSEEHDEDFVDWYDFDATGVDYTSYFVTGYKIRGDSQRNTYLGYAHIISANEEPTAYKIQGVWDYATSGDSGRWSSIQLVDIDSDWEDYGTVTTRRRIRGHGRAFQLKVSSVSETPFDIIGWSLTENTNAGN